MLEELPDPPEAKGGETLPQVKGAASPNVGTRAVKKCFCTDTRSQSLSGTSSRNKRIDQLVEYAGAV